MRTGGAEDPFIKTLRGAEASGTAAEHHLLLSPSRHSLLKVFRGVFSRDHKTSFIMNITISMLDGTSHSLFVDPQDTVGSLKTLIHEKFQVPPQRQKLVFDNGSKTPLSDDSRPVSYYGLQSGSRVSLLVTQPATIQVFLRNEKGQVNTYDIKPDETVSTFKTKVQCREGVQVNQQRLLHQSKEMVDGHRLSDYNVKEMSTIDLLLRLRGG